MNSIIIGANRGIGLELVRLLASRGDVVTATCRKSSSELIEIAPQSIIENIDITSIESLEGFAQSLPDESQDQVIIVAGILERNSLDALRPDSIRRQFEVNALGTLQAAVALIPKLKKGSKLGLITSRMGSIADNDSGGMYGYRMSKAALNAAGKSLAADLAPREIAVSLLHPGWVRTEMTGGTGHLEAAESAAGLIQRMNELSMKTTGCFVHQSGEALPW